MDELVRSHWIFVLLLCSIDDDIVSENFVTLLGEFESDTSLMDHEK